MSSATKMLIVTNYNLHFLPAMSKYFNNVIYNYDNRKRAPLCTVITSTQIFKSEQTQTWLGSEVVAYICKYLDIVKYKPFKNLHSLNCHR